MKFFCASADSVAQRRIEKDGDAQAESQQHRFGRGLGGKMRAQPVPAEQLEEHECAQGNRIGGG